MDHKLVINFGHGLGDNVMLTSFLRQLRIARPVLKIELNVRPARVSLFDGLADVVTGNLDPLAEQFSWPMCDTSYADSPSTNVEAKLRGMGIEPQPQARGYHIDVEPGNRNRAAEFLATWRPGKIAVLHYLGNAVQDRKNLEHWQANRIVEHLEAAGYDILIWDDNGRSPLPEQGIGRRLKEAPPLFEDSPGDCGMLAAILAEADLVVGIDSGLLHLASAVGTRAIGLWTRHHPLHFFCPDLTTTHLIPKKDWHSSHRWLVNKPWNAGLAFFERHYDHRYYIDVPGFYELPEVLADLLAENEFEAKLRRWLSLTEASRNGWGDLGPLAVDRHKGFAFIFEHLRGIDSPTIIETGTLRQPGNWQGDGNAASLFGLFTKHSGGEYHSIDNNATAVELATSWVREFGSGCQVHKADSVRWLEQFAGEADVVYLDSMDADLPGAAEHGLKEAQAVASKVKSGGLIAFDDTPEVGGRLYGKGALGAPWLVEQGWERVHCGYQQILRRAQ